MGVDVVGAACRSRTHQPGRTRSAGRGPRTNRAGDYGSERTGLSRAERHSRVGGRRVGGACVAKRGRRSRPRGAYARPRGAYAHARRAYTRPRGAYTRPRGAYAHARDACTNARGACAHAHCPLVCADPGGSTDCRSHCPGRDRPFPRPTRSLARPVTSAPPIVTLAEWRRSAYHLTEPTPGGRARTC